MPPASLPATQDPLAGHATESSALPLELTACDGDHVPVKV